MSYLVEVIAIACRRHVIAVNEAKRAELMQ